MRRLRTFPDDESAHEAARLLESAGIPVFVEETRHSRIGMSDARISVYLDSQFEDALLVLEDPTHEVRDPVDIEQFQKHLEKFDHSLVLNRTLLALVAAIVFFCLVAGASYFLKPSEQEARQGDWVH